MNTSQDTAPERPPGRLAPSVLSADHARLADELRPLEPFAGAVHVDFMDGHFVPTLGFAPRVVAGLRAATGLPLRCHLMVERPETFVDELHAAGADLVIAHAECGERAAAAVARTRELGLAAGLALKLDTPVEAVEPFLDEIETVLVMSIVPGWSGQSFNDEALPRIEALRRAADRRGRAIDIEVDGGVNEETGRRCIEAGATILAAASALFQAGDPVDAARRMAAVAAGA